LNRIEPLMQQHGIVVSEDLNPQTPLMSNWLADGCTRLWGSVCSCKQNWLLFCENVIVLQSLTTAHVAPCPLNGSGQGVMRIILLFVILFLAKWKYADTLWLRAVSCCYVYECAEANVCVNGK
jgi:hypothetical protein